MGTGAKAALKHEAMTLASARDACRTLKAAAELVPVPVPVLVVGPNEVAALVTLKFGAGTACSTSAIIASGSWEAFKTRREERELAVRQGTATSADSDVSGCRRLSGCGTVRYHRGTTWNTQGRADPRLVLLGVLMCSACRHGTMWVLPAVIVILVLTALLNTRGMLVGHPAALPH